MEVDNRIVKTEPPEEEPVFDNYQAVYDDDEEEEGEAFLPINEKDDGDGDAYNLSESQLETSILDAINMMNNQNEVVDVPITIVKREIIHVSLENETGDNDGDEISQDDGETQEAGLVLSVKNLGRSEEATSPSITAADAARRSMRKRKFVSKSFEVEDEDEELEGRNKANHLELAIASKGVGRKKRRKSSQHRQTQQSKPTQRQKPGPKSKRTVPKGQATEKRDHPHPPVPVSEMEKKANKFLLVPLVRCDKELGYLHLSKTRSSRDDDEVPPPPPLTASTEAQMNRFACQYCQKPFPTLVAVSTHLSQTFDEFEDEEIPCSVCDFTFQRLPCLEYHLSSHFKVKCRFCDELFTRDKDLFEHFTTLHLKKKTISDSFEVEAIVQCHNEVFQDTFPIEDDFDGGVSDFGGADDNFSGAEDNDDIRNDPNLDEKSLSKRGRGRPRKHPKVVLSSSSSSPSFLKKLKKKSKHSKKMKKLKKGLQLKSKVKQEVNPAGDAPPPPDGEEPLPPRPQKRKGRPPRIYSSEELWEMKKKQEARRKAVLKRMKDQVKKAKSNCKKTAKKRKASQDKKAQEDKTQEAKRKIKMTPISHQDFLRAHRIHRVITSSELLTREIPTTTEVYLKRTSPSVGNGTFENPYWTLINNSDLHCICPACGRTFRSRKELGAHHQQSHSQICSSCSICGKPQVKASRLARHVKGHCSSDELTIRYELEVQQHGTPPPKQDDRLYKCFHCGKVLIGWLPLTVHEKYWHDIEAEDEPEPQAKSDTPKSYICELCGKSVKTKHNLKKHMKKHKRAMKRVERGEPEKPPRKSRRGRHNDPAMCPTCGKVFKTNCSLKAHERYKHSEESQKSTKVVEQMQCPICARPFSSRRFIHTHVPTHMNKEEKSMFNSWNGTLEEFSKFLEARVEPKVPVDEVNQGQQPDGGRGGGNYRRQFAAENEKHNPMTAELNLLHAYATSSTNYLNCFVPR